MQMPFLTDSQWNLVLAVVGSSLLGNVYSVAMWLYKQARNSQIEASFVEEMAKTHLPFIYSALQALCEKSGVDMNDHPNIGFIKLNGKYVEKDS